MKNRIWAKKVVGMAAFLILFIAKAQPAMAATKYWIGPAGGSFSANANWSTSSGGANNTTAPKAADIATFDSGGNTNCAMDQNVNVAGINIASIYTGTISQEAGNNIKVGSGAFTMAGGTLNLGDATVTVKGNWTYSGGTLNAGTSTVVFASTLTITGSHTLNNVTLDGNSNSTTTLTITSGTILTVAGTLTLDNSKSGATVINTGTIAPKGNVTVADSLSYDGSATILINGTGDQLFTGSATRTVGLLPTVNINKPSGTLTLSGTFRTTRDWTYTAGTVDPGTSTVVFAGARTITGTHTLYNVELAGAGVTHTIAANDTLTVNGTLTLTDGTITQATFPATGSVVAKGNITFASTFDGGTGVLMINGTGDQLFTGSATRTVGLLPTVNINKPSGTLTLSGTIRTSNNWTYTAGTVDPGTSTVVFRPQTNASPFLTITGSHALNNVTIDSNTSSNYTMNITAGTTLTVNGTLTLDNTSTGATTINRTGATGTIAPKGNVTVADNLSYSGSAALLINGTGKQTFTGPDSGSITIPAVTINKPSGAVVLASNVTLAGTYTSLTVSAGTLDMNGYALNAPGTLTNDGVILASGAGTPITAGTLTTNVATSRVNYLGNVADGAVTVKAGTYGLLKFDNSGTTFTLGGAVTTQGDLTITAGSTLDASAKNYAVTVGENWSNAGTFVSRKDTVTLNGINQALTGATTFYTLSKAVTASDMLTLPAGAVTTVTNRLEFSGANNGLYLFLRSSAPGTKTSLTVSGGTQSICAVDLKDIDSSGGMQLTALNSSDSGNNVNWVFQTLGAGCFSNGLIANWMFDEGTGQTTADSTASGFTAILGSTPSADVNDSAWVAGKFGNALQFSGTKIITFPAAGLGTVYTVAMWVNPTVAFGCCNTLLYQDTSNMLYLTGTALRFTIGNNSITSVNYNAMPVGTWHHLAFVRNGTSATFYQDGSQLGTAQTSPSNANFSPIRFGASGTVGSLSAPFQGKLDEVRLYNRILSDQEIASLAGNGGTGVLNLKDADSGDTTLTNSASISVGFTNLESNATAYVLSNTNGSFGGTAAITATPTFPPTGSAPITWTLSGGDGDKFVYARITKGSTTYDISRSITLDATPPAAPTGLTLTANSDDTAITAAVMTPASSDVTKLHWRYVALDGNVAPSYPATYTAGTALGAGVTSNVVPSTSYSITATSLTQQKTYCVAVWAVDKAGNVSATAAQAYLFLSPPTPRLVVTAAVASAQAGSGLVLTITARDAGGSVNSNYAGPYSLTWTPIGASAVTLVTSSAASWSGGVVTALVTVGGSDAGLGTFTAIDNSSTGLTNGTLSFTFYPASFTVTTSGTALTAGKAFTLTATAKDTAGVTVTRYAGTVAISLSATPTATKSLSAASMTATAGVGSISLSYPDCASAATITCSDTTYVSGVTIQGSSSSVSFIPDKFKVTTALPPPRRTVWYLGEPVLITVQALAAAGAVTPNYRGTVKFSAVNGLSLSSDYAFTAADAGKHEFTGITVTSAGTYTVSVSDSVNAAVTGASGPFAVVQGRVLVSTVFGPVGTLSVLVRIVDPVGNIIPDDTTMLTVTLAEEKPDGSASVSPATVHFRYGHVNLLVTDSAGEKVTVGGSTNPTLPVTSAVVTFGSSTSTYHSSFQYITFEQAPGSYTITPTYSYPTTSSISLLGNMTFSQLSQMNSFTQAGHYDTGTYRGLAFLQSSYLPTSFTGYASPTGTNAHSGFTGFTTSVKMNKSTRTTDMTFSPAAFEAGTVGLPPPVAASMQSYFRRYGDFGGTFAPGSFGDSAPDASGSAAGGAPAWMSATGLGGSANYFGGGDLGGYGSFGPGGFSFGRDEWEGKKKKGNVLQKSTGASSAETTGVTSENGSGVTE